MSSDMLTRIEDLGIEQVIAVNSYTITPVLEFASPLRSGTSCQNLSSPSLAATSPAQCFVHFSELVR